MERKLCIGYHARLDSQPRHAALATAIASIEDATRSARSAGYLVVPYVAMFASNPRTGGNAINDEEARACGAIAKEHGARIVWHAAFVDLPTCALVTSRRGATRAKVMDRIARLGQIARLSDADLVIHMSDCNTSHALADALRDACAAALGSERSSRIYFEPIAQHSALFADPVRMGELMRRIGCGLCIDTAHVWAAGADISTGARCIQFLSAIENAPLLIHLNDSTEPRGSGHDHHAQFCSGEIWRVASPWVDVARWASERDIPMIIERRENAQAIADIALLASQI